MPRPPSTDTPTPDTRNAIAAQAERRARAREALVRVRQRLSWQAARELQRRLNLRPETLEPRDLVSIAKLEQGDAPKTLTLTGDPSRPLIIGLEPARDSLARAEEARALPAPDLSQNGRLVPQRINLAALAKPEPATDP